MEEVLTIHKEEYKGLQQNLIYTLSHENQVGFDEKMKWRMTDMYLYRHKAFKKQYF